jgi:hypothetical protein
MLVVVLRRQRVELRDSDFLSASTAFVNAPIRSADSGFIRGIEHGTAAVRQFVLPLIKCHGTFLSVKNISFYQGNGASIASRQFPLAD